MERSRKTPAVVMILLGLGIFLLPFTPRWMVDWAVSGGAEDIVFLISPLSLVVTASVGSVLFLTGMWKLYDHMREDRE